MRGMTEPQSATGGRFTVRFAWQRYGSAATIGLLVRLTGASCSDDGCVANVEDRDAARKLAAQAMSPSEPMSGRVSARAALGWMTGGRRLVRQRGRAIVPYPSALWRDTVSPLRAGWRQRAARLGGQEVFAVDYQFCLRCGMGWVEEPYTIPEYERCGLASAGLAALRAEHPGLQWHTLGGHLSESEPFWRAVGAGVPGGYRKCRVCPHRTSG